ncbi:hypothetical protein Q8F55_007339 [Vanrija albida]|uniref:Xylanolytic transcriptional activator regulatory domain-containing protein n=1 Tax=Vanrija albida TaxID=181172 RepID=A0ABR3PZK1_9TREE
MNAPLLDLAPAPERRPAPVQSLVGSSSASSRGGLPSSVSPATTVSPAVAGASPSQSRSRARILRMSEYLDPNDREQAPSLWANAPGRPPREMPRRGLEEEYQEASDRDDPVSLRALSEVEANYLVQQFHDRLNPLIALLDPQLHTLRFLRTTSTVLLSAVLASASRFFRSDLHPTLISHARTLLDRAIQTGAFDTGVVQVLLIHTYFKEPEDTSGWFKVGMALRIAYSMFWHIPRTDPLPENDDEARDLLNTERTWLALFSFDRAQSHLHGLPTTIKLNQFRDPEIWAREHLHLGHTVDMHIACSIQFCQLDDHWVELCELKDANPEYLEHATETLARQLDAFENKWFNKNALPPGFNYEHELAILWSVLDFKFMLKRYRYERAPHDLLRLDEGLQVSSSIIDVIDQLANNGMLEIMQDSAIVKSSALVVFCRKVFGIATQSQQSYILTILHRMLVSHAKVTSADGKSALDYVSRFIRRVLSVLGTEGQATDQIPELPVTQAIADASLGADIQFFESLGLVSRRVWRS